MIARKNFDNYTARFPANTLDRIERALRGRENKADFIRAAVEEKLALRERKEKRAAPSDAALPAPEAPDPAEPEASLEAEIDWGSS